MVKDRRLKGRYASETVNDETMVQVQSISVNIGEGRAASSSLTEYLLQSILPSYSSAVHFIFLSFGVFTFYLIYGYELELIFKLEGMQPHGWYLTFVQFIYYSLFALVQLWITGKSIHKRIPLRTYIAIALLTVGTMGFSNSSMGYLNYPTQVIFKSCKLIPVMLGSVLILKKTYGFIQVLACLCMSAGLIWFSLADSSVQPNFSLQGVVLVSMALVCDAVIGNVQEGAMQKYEESTTHVVLYSYSIGFLAIFGALVISGHFVTSVAFSNQHPWEVYGRAVLLSAAGFCGVQVVLSLVAHYGALVAVTVTTFRKALSIILSFMFFEKPFTIQYVWGGLLVVCGIYLNIFSRQVGNDVSLVGSLQKLCIRFQKLLTLKRSINVHSNQHHLINV